jgi:phage I-like protein
MDLSSIAKALGLGEDASVEEILRAIATLNSAPTTMTAIASALGVAEGADLVAVATALKGKADNVGNPDPAKFVPVETVAALQTSVQSLQGMVDGMQADKRKAKIDAAQEDGKLAPALVTYATSIADDAKLDEFLAALPGNTLGKGKAAGDPPADKTKLTADELAVCSATGISQEDFLAARAAETEGN